MIEQTRNSSALSALARGLLERLDLGRLVEWTVPRDELQRELAAMGWPCSEAVLRAEEAVGGFSHPPNGVFGVHASLRYLRGEVPWLRDDLQCYDLRADPRDGSLRLLPVWLVHDPRLWLALDGRVYYGSHIDGPGYLALAFEDVCHYWEVLALLDGFVVAFIRPLAMPRPRLEASSFAGEAIAHELGLSSFTPASRGATRAWIGPGLHAVELDIPGFKRGTDVVSDTAEGIVLAAAQALDAGGTARITSPEALGAELLATLPATTREEFMTSHVYIWGKHADYEDDRYRRRHRGS
ncbi:hypothetical protein WMF20_17955 [Sorangium sp. So ce834]|uniref:hypothetical protein n=1 Tax=Sorangium sp. So ce834 TaxID=3133321 RepID=UPI003F623ED6